MELSKELLSEVLGFEIDEVFYYNDNLVFFQKASDKEEYNINIYELANKCKEWAAKNGYTLSSTTRIPRIEYNFKPDIDFGPAYAVCYINLTITLSENRHPHYARFSKCLKEDTESDAIFKACQWILDNKEIRYLPGLSDYKYGGTK